MEDDGVEFVAETVRGGLIREEQEYEGVRVSAEARIGTARVRLQVDVGFGDAVTPEAAEAELPTLLDAPPPMLRAYPKETVIAEKLQALVVLGMLNSRMKDFYDLWRLARHDAFDGHVLTEAVQATFARRDTSLPKDVPVGLAEEFATDAGKQAQWRAFVRRGRLAEEAELEEVIASLRAFLLPVLEAARVAPTHTASALEQRWEPGGPWK